mmetsp:Transcript_16430/g.34858  ORF Transcript_16430/g.34858 Transcript_16430/m.34858 type:complete len:787 (-) Transcript_16430:1862-4222(-)
MFMDVDDAECPVVYRSLCDSFSMDTKLACDTGALDWAEDLASFGTNGGDDALHVNAQLVVYRSIPPHSGEGDGLCGDMLLRGMALNSGYSFSSTPSLQVNDVFDSGSLSPQQCTPREAYGGVPSHLDQYGCFQSSLRIEHRPTLFTAAEQDMSQPTQLVARRMESERASKADLLDTRGNAGMPDGTERPAQFEGFASDALAATHCDDGVAGAHGCATLHPHESATGLGDAHVTECSLNLHNVYGGEVNAVRAREGAGGHAIQGEGTDGGLEAETVCENSDAGVGAGPGVVCVALGAGSNGMSNSIDSSMYQDTCPVAMVHNDRDAVGTWAREHGCEAGCRAAERRDSCSVSRRNGADASGFGRGGCWPPSAALTKTTTAPSAVSSEKYATKSASSDVNDLVSQLAHMCAQLQLENSELQSQFRQSRMGRAQLARLNEQLRSSLDVSLEIISPASSHTSDGLFETAPVRYGLLSDVQETTVRGPTCSQANVPDEMGAGDDNGDDGDDTYDDHHHRASFARGCAVEGAHAGAGKSGFEGRSGLRQSCACAMGAAAMAGGGGGGGGGGCGGCGSGGDSGGVGGGGGSKRACPRTEGIVCTLPAASLEPLRPASVEASRDRRTAAPSSPEHALGMKRGRSRSSQNVSAALHPQKQPSDKDRDVASTHHLRGGGDVQLTNLTKQHDDASMNLTKLTKLLPRELLAMLQSEREVRASLQAQLVQNSIEIESLRRQHADLVAQLQALQNDAQPPQPVHANADTGLHANANTGLHADADTVLRRHYRRASPTRR